MSDATHMPLAIIGMACRLPGADNLEQYWQLIKDGQSAVQELPAERFPRDLYYDPEKGKRAKSYSSIGGIVSERPLDRQNCRLPEKLVVSADKAHLELCDVAAAACRHAGLDPFNLPQRRAGVYIGHTRGTGRGGDLVYSTLVEHTAQYLRQIEGFDQLVGGQTDEVIDELVQSVRSDVPRQDGVGPDLSANQAARIVAMALGLDGPYMAINAACASSLMALAMGGRALRLGQIDLAVVGGASHCKFDSLVLFSKAQSVSATGSRPFDAEADGLVTAEGYVALLVKTLERALADGDPIQAVIRGIGVASDGRGKSLWAPRKEGQIQAIRRAYEPDVDVRQLQYIEAHATSTQVGDATELAALIEALQGRIPVGKKIPVGSVKANIGHTLETAGLAGLVKTVLAMQNRLIPPAINVRNLNPSIDWERAPLFVPTGLLSWPDPEPGQPRRAAVNAFGIGGLNAHVVLDEYLPHTCGTTPPAIRSVPASAATGPSLDQAVAVTGMASIFPGAQTLDAYWDLLLSGRDPKSEVPPDRWDARIAYRPACRDLWHSPSKWGGFITDFVYDWRKHKVPPKQIANADPLQFMLLEAVDQAFRSAGYDQETLPRQRTAVVVGTIFGGDFANQLQMGFRLPDFEHRLAQALRKRGVPEERIREVAERYGDLLLERMPALEDETGSFTTSTLASRITKTFDLMGGALALDAGGASAMAALNVCIDTLRTGECDVMVCAAGQRSMGLPTYARLSLAGLLSPGQPSNPLDARSDGLLPAEGVGVLVLKRLADAQRDGDKVHAIIRGIGVARSDCLSSAVQTAILRSLSEAGVEPGDVSLVETAAVGSQKIVSGEVQALEAGYKGPRREPLLLDSVAGQIGYTFGASGMAAFQKAALSLDRQQVPAGQAVQTPLPCLRQHSGLRMLAQNTPLAVCSDEGRLLAGVNSCCNPDLAYHVVIERGQKVTPPVRRAAAEACFQPVPGILTNAATCRIVRVGAGTRSELLDKAAQCQRDRESWFARADGQTFTPGDRYRLAVVASDPADLAEKIRLALEKLQTADPQPVPNGKGIFWGQPAEQRPQVAFLFPGQGSQYGGMLQPLTQQYEPAARALEEMDRTLAPLGYPSFAEVAWHGSEQLGVNVWHTQLSLLIADSIVYAALTALGVHADRISGHSFGEFPALLAAGAWTFEAAARATYARCQSVTASRLAQGRMLGTSAAAPMVEEMCQGVEGRVYVANYNSPRQTVAAGEQQALAVLAEQLQQAGHAARVLAVPRPFHTPLMGEVREPLARALREIALGPPRIPMLSSVTNRYVAEPDEIRSNLVEQMTRPVRYIELIERLADEGVTIFVEVGPDRVLSQLHRQILSGRDVTILAADERRGGGLGTLLQVRACLETLGLMDHPADAPNSRASAAEATAAPVVQRREHGISPSGGGVSSEVRASHSQTPALIDCAGMALLRLTGSPYEMGLQHGRQQQAAIRTILRRYADLAGLSADRLPPLEPVLEYVEDFFGPEDLEELRGIAEGAEVSWESVLAHNLRIYPDLYAGCVHFACTARAGGSPGMLHAANEDLPLTLTLRDCLRRNIQLRFPLQGEPYVTFGTPGQAGGINGFNAAGVGVTSAMLLDLPRRAATARGRLHACLVKRILERAENLDMALDIVKSQPGTGAWGLCISHHSSDSLCYLEYDGKRVQVHPQPSLVLAANHSQLHSAVAAGPEHSRRRLERLTQLLGNPASAAITIEQTQAALQDRYDGRLGRRVKHLTMNTVCRVDNQLSLVMQPAAGRIWVTAGPGSQEAPARFYPLELDQLFGRGGPQRRKSRDNGRAAGGPAKGGNSDTEEAAPPTPELSMVISPAEFAAASTSVHGKPPIEVGDQVCHRFVTRVMEQPLTDSGGGTPRLEGAAVILGDNAVAQALLRRIQQHGGQAIVLPTAEPEETLAALERHWQSAPMPHLFLTTPHDPDAATSLEPQAWQARRNRGVLLPYWVAQRWLQLISASGLVPQATLVACTALGGDFGFSGQVLAAESGALTGLLKALRVEMHYATHQRFRAKAVDTSGGRSPDEIAEAMCDELADWQDSEVGYLEGRRYVVRPVIDPLASPADDQVPRGGTWIITGGARGVTAVVARELGRRFGLRLHLLGSSSLPQMDPAWRDLPAEGLRELRSRTMREAAAAGRVPAEAWAAVEKAIEIDNNLRAFAEGGVQVTYHTCDVGDRASLARLLDQIRAAGDRIEGVLHGAGFERACRFDKKNRELVERTLAAKVDAAIHLMDLTRHDPLRCFLAFGSISGRFGGNGQTDYCLANDMLAKLVQWFRTQRPDCRSALFHWHSWDEVGMAVRPESMHIKKLLQFQYMPTREGTQHLVQELCAGLPEGEILITDWPYYKRFYPDPVRPAGATSPVASPEVAAPLAAGGPAPITAPPVSLDPQIAPRHVLRLQHSPLDSQSAAEWRPAGPALILGDPEEVRGLQQQIARAGVTAYVLPRDASEADALATLERYWAEQPVPHLFLVTSRQQQSVEVMDQELLHRVRLPFLIGQRWVQLLASRSGPASLVGVTALGGDFGFAQVVAAPEGGALAGWLKSVHVENCRQGRDQLLVKVLDFPTGEPAGAWARAVLDELSAGRRDVEVSYRDGQRYTVRAEYHPVAADDRLAIRRGSTWVVTGGARGITARCALELGRRFGLKLHLLGRQPAPANDNPNCELTPEQLQEWKKTVTRQALARGQHPGRQWQSIQKDLEIARNLRAFAEAAVPVTYHACDVTDRKALAQTLDQIRRQDGPIEGILHGAGLRIPARFEGVRRADLEATIAVKGHATLALIVLTQADPVRHFLAFSSIGGRFGTNGGTVYALGNEMLAKLVGWLRGQRPDCRASAFHWHGWAEVGMMTEGASFGAQTVLDRLMPAAEGVQHLLAEVDAGLPEPEVLFTDGRFHRPFYPAEMVIGPGRSSDPDSSTDRCRRPMLDIVPSRISGPRLTAEAHLDPTTEPFLLQHQFRNRPLLPIVIAIEMLAEAAALLCPDRIVAGIDDLEIVSGLRFFTDQTVRVRVEAELRGDQVATQLVSDFLNRRGQLVQRDRPYARGTVPTAARPLNLSVSPLQESVVWADVWYPPEREEVLYHGPIFRRLEAISFGDETGWAKISSAPLEELAGRRGTQGWLHSPAMLDACLFACGVFLWSHHEKVVAIPQAIRRLRWGRHPRTGETCVLHFEYRGQREQRAWFDFVLHGQDGTVLMQVEDFQAAVVAGQSS